MKKIGIEVGILLALASLITASADTVTLSNGDQLQGEVVREQEDMLIFQSEVFPQPLEIPLDSVTSVAKSPADASEQAPETAEAASPKPTELAAPVDPAPLPEQEPAESAKLQLPENWNATLGLGYSDSQNETAKTREVSADGTLVWEGEHREAEWRGYYRYQSHEEEKSADRYGASQRLRHRGDDGFFVQAQTKAEVDNLTKNRTQISQTAGLGYSPVKDEKLAVNITPGVKAEHVAAADKENQLGTAYKAHVNQDLKWKVTDKVAVGQALSYSIDPRHTENWDMDINAYVETQVSEDVNLRVNYRRDFLNQSDGAEDKKSSEVGAALVWNF